ncbi:hypothetical protein AVEN_21971-1 [Araneus ventricosus]|uniref:Uncharacterized protein n=1 Tax=Araneus ventricosus TaxID=182803 RepID=A0A4Y2LDG1_ARAVE|nr:hypothetical protein AVEN_21971-1 [Araneus ventricosus]
MSNKTIYFSLKSIELKAPHEHVYQFPNLYNLMFFLKPLVAMAVEKRDIEGAAKQPKKVKGSLFTGKRGKNDPGNKNQMASETPLVNSGVLRKLGQTTFWNEGSRQP